MNCFYFRREGHWLYIRMIVYRQETYTGFAVGVADESLNYSVGNTVRMLLRDTGAVMARFSLSLSPPTTFKS